jgi:flavin-binding protein dodecin
MSVARVTELSATSAESFEDAINEAVNRATSTLRNVESAYTFLSANQRGPESQRS